MLKNEDVVRRIRRADCLKYEEFDSTYSVNTRHDIRPAKDGSGDMVPSVSKNSTYVPGSNGYGNSPLEYLDMLNEELGKNKDICNYTFVDVGSGKGRVIFHNLIKNSPYKDYVGVEGDTKFHNTAISNIKTFNMPITKNVSFVNINALDYIVDNTDCVYYFYLPFEKAVFDRFMENNWDIIKNTKSYFAFLFEGQYDMSRYLDKGPIYDYAELTIYKVND